MHRHIKPKHLPDIPKGVKKIRALVADRTCNTKPFLAATHGLMIRRMAVGSTKLSVQCARHAAWEDLMNATCE